MKLRLVKIGNSYSIRIPKKVAEPFITVGEIEVDIILQSKESVPGAKKQKKVIIHKSEPKKETVWDRKIASL